MFWSQTQTDRDWAAAQLVSEQLRHERLEREASIISPIESTPAGEPTPPITMTRLREAKLQQGAQVFRDIWTDDKDEQLPM